MGAGAPVWILAFLLLFVVSVRVRGSGCPNGCAGHGSCGANNMCTCHIRWQGSDCSLRTCRFGPAFHMSAQGDLNFDGDREDHTDLTNVDATVVPVPWHPVGSWEKWPRDGGNASLLRWTSTTADGHGGFMLENVDDDEAHHSMECSNVGYCNRETGLCECFPGYEGVACARASCPGHCSGHGMCETLEHLAAESKFATVHTHSVLATQQTACKCDPGYSGGDCSMRACPRGDDPMTAFQTNEIQASGGCNLLSITGLCGPRRSGEAPDSQLDQRRLSRQLWLYAVAWCRRCSAWTTRRQPSQAPTI